MGSQVTCISVQLDYKFKGLQHPLPFQNSAKTNQNSGKCYTYKMRSQKVLSARVEVQHMSAQKHPKRCHLGVFMEVALCRPDWLKHWHSAWIQSPLFSSSQRLGAEALIFQSSSDGGMLTYPEAIWRSHSKSSYLISLNWGMIERGLLWITKDTLIRNSKG
jgi:hypothetical protein